MAAQLMRAPHGLAQLVFGLHARRRRPMHRAAVQILAHQPRGVLRSLRRRERGERVLFAEQEHRDLGPGHGAPRRMNFVAAAVLAAAHLGHARRVAGCDGRSELGGEAVAFLEEVADGRNGLLDRLACGSEALIDGGVVVALVVSSVVSSVAMMGSVCVVISLVSFRVC